MTAVATDTHTTDARTTRSQRVRRAAALAAMVPLVLLVTACGGGPGSQEEFEAILTRGGNLTDEEAQCISAEVFAQYGEDAEALGKLSAAPDIEFLEGAEGIPGFSDFFDSAVGSCLQVGPSN